MLTKSIIVSGISNLSDARYCAGMGVAYLGVCADPTDPTYLSVDKFNEINGWLSGISWILEMANADVEEILAVCEKYEVVGVYTDSVTTALALLQHGKQVLFKSDAETSPQKLAQYDLLGVVVDYSTLVASINHSTKLGNTPIYVHGAVDLDELQSIQDDKRIAGVMLQGGMEERPGFKNMDDLIDALEIFEL